MIKENLVSTLVKMFIDQGFPAIEYAQEVFSLTNDESTALNEFALENSLSKNDCIRIESINTTEIKVQVLTHDGKTWVKSFIEVECNILDFPKWAIKAITNDISPKEFNGVLGEELTAKGYISDSVRSKFDSMIESYDDFWNGLTEDLRLDFLQVAEIELSIGLKSA